MGKTPATHRFSDYAVEEFTKEWMDIVKQNYNHPCIITWTAFNESRGIAFNNADSSVAYGRRAETKEEFIERIDSLTSAIKEIPYISGYCFAQVSDAAQENNRRKVKTT